MSRDQLKGMVIITSILLAVVSLIAFGGIMQSESYKDATYQNCK